MVAGYSSPLALNRLTDLSSKFAAQVTFIVSDFAPDSMDELDVNVLSICAEAKRQTNSATLEVYCVFYLREETVVFVVFLPIRRFLPVVVLVSLMDELPIVDT